ncbi:MAG: 30S ribosomal protein S4 [Candidatus Fischerbacteria bacterium RBG_13_37_8]|uniref:Small ribosomal subunit protein uS4 n=1 Tax=Candidatus Fischerbacteria bacterium RBG_13_37_8 TaxID=1817863 RepID=A0A1F5VEJ5_9BACT|nr:MAG: 30S ribosomal protein S4 [Candidatus Fischerbacteria bacterium RBG_13_37_8]
MSRYKDSVCRLCRREMTKLFLKGDRCYAKCPLEKRAFPPGQHGRTKRIKLTPYGIQLREKQKVKRIYGVLEKQFRLYFEKAEKMKGVTGENLLIFLERRLDNVIFRLGFSTSRSHARQLVNHGHVLVNNKKIDIPSYLTCPGDSITLKENALKTPNVAESIEKLETRGLPPWLEFDTEAKKGRVLAFPRRDDIQFPIQEQYIVELYSK